LRVEDDSGASQDFLFQLPFGLRLCRHAAKEVGTIPPGTSGFNCLSAYGFVGTVAELTERVDDLERFNCLSAYGFVGTSQRKPKIPSRRCIRFNCLSAYGFVGTHQDLRGARRPPAGFNCLSAYGFVGTRDRCGGSRVRSGQVSIAFRLTALSAPKTNMKPKRAHNKFQLPFGLRLCRHVHLRSTRNGSASSFNCLSAYGFVGTKPKKTENPFAPLYGFNCLSAYGFVGTRAGWQKAVRPRGPFQLPFGLRLCRHGIYLAQEATSAAERFNCLSAYGFVGTVIL